MLGEFSTEVQQLVDRHMATGQYSSSDELFAVALRALDERTRRLEVLREELQIGRDQLDRGDCSTHDAQSLRAYFDRLQADGMARYHARRSVS